MDIVKGEDGRKWHVGCGGEVIRGVCVKCGQKKPGLVKRILGEGPFIIKEKDDVEARREAHRERIRKGKDIFRE